VIHISNNFLLKNKLARRLWPHAPSSLISEIYGPDKILLAINHRFARFDIVPSPPIRSGPDRAVLVAPLAGPKAASGLADLRPRRSSGAEGEPLQRHWCADTVKYILRLTATVKNVVHVNSPLLTHPPSALYDRRDSTFTANKSSARLRPNLNTPESDRVIIPLLDADPNSHPRSGGRFFMGPGVM
jgi:hypothetical protein